MAITVVHTTAANASPVTIPSTTAGNCLIVCIASFNSTAQASVSGVTLGGAADNFADTGATGHGVAPSEFADSFIWADPNCAGGQTSVAISGSNLGLASGSGGIIIYEVSGLAASSVTDQVNHGGSTVAGTSWTSNTTPTTTQASEFWAGVADVFNPVGPGAPWTNTSAGTGAISGEQIVSSTGTATYNGTQQSSSWAASVATFKGAGTPGTANKQPPAGPRPRPVRRGFSRGQPGSATPFGTARRQAPYTPPRRAPTRGLSHGQAGSAAPFGTANRQPPAGPRPRPVRRGVSHGQAGSPTPITPRVVIADDSDAPWHIRSRRRRT